MVEQFFYIQKSKPQIIFLNNPLNYLIQHVSHMLLIVYALYVYKSTIWFVSIAFFDLNEKKKLYSKGCWKQMIVFKSFVASLYVLCLLSFKSIERLIYLYIHKSNCIKNQLHCRKTIFRFNKQRWSSILFQLLYW